MRSLVAREHAELLQLQRDYSAQSSTITTLNAEKSKVSDQFKTLQAQVSRMCSSQFYGAMEQILTWCMLSIELEQLATLYQRAQAQSEQLQAANTQIQSELSKASQQARDQHSQISSLESEKASLIAKVRRLESAESSVYTVYAL